jgi:hypothetical protein
MSAGARIRETRTRRIMPSEVGAFLEAETRLLDEAMAMVRERLASTGAARDDERRLAEAVGHAWVHFPDEPDLGSRSFLARAIPAHAARRERVVRATGATAAG